MRISSLVILFSVVLVTCGGAKPTESVCSTGGIEDGVQISPPRQDRDAELLALWWSRSVSAPNSLYDEIREDLKEVRLAADDFTTSAVHFQTSWYSNQIYITLKQGRTLANLACVNQKLRLSSSRSFQMASDVVYVLQFDTRFYPAAVTNAYLYNTAFVQTASGYNGGDVGIGRDWNIFFWKYPDRRTYLFFQGRSKEVPTDHDHDWYEYFSVTTSVTFIGSWRSGITPEPPWLQEALQAKKRFEDEKF